MVSRSGAIRIHEERDLIGETIAGDSMPETGKHPGGRPRKYKTVAEMEEAITAYFERCDARTRNVTVGPPSNRQVQSLPSPEPYTVAGLAFALGIDRKTLLRYEAEERIDEFGEGFRPVIRLAKARIEENVERRMLDGDGWGPGYIFNLKNNFGWRDTYDHNVKSAVVLRFDKEDEGL